jgi:Fur family ferric uptake transcriptional regulator
MRGRGYATKQREAIYNYLASLDGEHVTADKIESHFAATATPIGRATIYRYLDRLVQEGSVQRFASGGQESACYRFIPAQTAERCTSHFHLRCDTCGELIHLECDELDEIAAHVYQEHAFKIDPLKTIFYGTCAQCAQKEEGEQKYDRG